MARKPKQEIEVETALVPHQPTALVKGGWEELEEYAKDEAAKEQAPSGNFVSTKGGVLNIMGNPMKDNKANVIVLTSVYENVFYEDDYDSDNPQPPVCYAFSETDEGLRPHPKVTEPRHDQCKGCEMNEWGTASKGKGKACKNSRRLAMLSAEDLSAEAIKDGPVAIAKLPVTSVKAWQEYVKNTFGTYKRPVFGFVTEVSLVPDPKSQYKWCFKMVGLVEGEYAAALKARRDAFMETGVLTAPYAEKTEAPPPPPKPTKGKRSKF